MDSAEQFSVVEVLKGSFNLIRNKPIILLPQLIVLILFYLPDVIGEYLEANNIIPDPWSSLYILVPLILLAVVYALLLLIIPPIVDAMYPLLVKDIIEGKEVDLKATFRAAEERILSIWGAMFLVSLIVFLGLIFFVIPGLIFLAWYYYTIPAIMLKNLGATEGMSASKDFAKDKKFKTFLLYSTPFFVIIILTDIYPALSLIIDLGLILFLVIWIAVVPAYAYIRYACEE